MSVKTILKPDFLNKFRRSKSGIAGVTILFLLIGMSIYAAAAVPLDSFRQWINPNYWIKYPKSAMPAWTNIFTSKKQPEQLIKDNAIVTEGASYQGVKNITYTYKFAFNYRSEEHTSEL